MSNAPDHKPGTDSGTATAYLASCDRQAAALRSRQDMPVNPRTDPIGISSAQGLYTAAIRAVRNPTATNLDVLRIHATGYARANDQPDPSLPEHPEPAQRG